MTSTPTRTHRACGFSLTELLVVLGILACLVGLLLPTISKARQMALGTQCLSNLRQMVIAANAYAAAYQGYYPIAYYTYDSGSTTVSVAWDLTTSWGSAVGSAVVKPGLLWQGEGTDRIQQCPSFEGASNWLVDPYTGYNYNTSYLGHGEYEAIRTPARMAAVQSPARTAIFGDGQWQGGANKFMRAPFPNPGDATFSGRWAGTQGFRHLKRTNVAFCDGHVESIGERFTANANGAENVAAGTGFLSADNQMYDLK